MVESAVDLSLSEAHFREIKSLLYRMAGIQLHDKKDLVKTRLMKRMKTLGMKNFSDYMEYLKRDSSRRELAAMVDVLTTNKTSFFREPKHFEFLRRSILPELKDIRRIRIWSAGCSSGEEPFSIAITLRESISDISRWDIKILATDISARMLAIAREAKYDSSKLEGVPSQILNRYFTRIKDGSSEIYRVNDDVRSMVQFARLNLMSGWPMKGPFDLIFCRNVMIYFDNPTRERLIHRFWELLKPGGYLFVGHSESLAPLEHRFQYIQPAIYRK